MGDVDGRDRRSPRTDASPGSTPCGSPRTSCRGLRDAGVHVEVTGTPGEYRYTDEAPVVRLSTTESAERDWFDLGVTVTIGGEDVPFEALFVALSHGDSHLVLDSGTWFAIDRPELAQLRELIEEARTLQDRPGAGLRLSAYQADLWEELAQLGVVEQQSRRWSEAVSGLLGPPETSRTRPSPPASRRRCGRTRPTGSSG